jgi:hypothetical protein
VKTLLQSILCRLDNAPKKHPQVTLVKQPSRVKLGPRGPRPGRPTISPYVFVAIQSATPPKKYSASFPPNRQETTTSVHTPVHLYTRLRDMQIPVLDVRVVIWGSLQPAYILGYTSIIILSPARKRKRTRGLPQKTAFVSVIRIRNPSPSPPKAT